MEAILYVCTDLNRLKQTGAGFGRRILLFDVSKVDGYKSQYIGLMNAAFTATKSVGQLMK